MPSSRDRPDERTSNKDGSGDGFKNSFKRVGKALGMGKDKKPNTPEIQPNRQFTERSTSDVEWGGSGPKEEESGKEVAQVPERKESLGVDFTQPPLSPHQSYRQDSNGGLPEPLTRPSPSPHQSYQSDKKSGGLGITTVSDQSHYLEVEETRRSGDSYVRGEEDPLTLGNQGDALLSNGTHQRPHLQASAMSQDRTAQLPSRKPIANSLPESGRPLPQLPFADTVRNRFTKEAAISVGNPGDQALVDQVVDEVILIAEKEIQSREENASKHRRKVDSGENQTMAGLKASINKYIDDASEKDATLGRKEQDLLKQASRIRALEDEVSKMKEAQTHVDILERSYQSAFVRKEKELNDLHQQKIGDLESTHQKRIHDVEARHALEISDLTEAHARRDSNKDESHRKAISDLEESRARQASEKHETHCKAISDLQTQHANTVLDHALAVSALEEQITKKKAEISDLIKSHKEDTAEIYQKCKAEIAKRQTEFDDELDNLTKEVEEVRIKSESDEKAHEADKKAMARKHNSAIMLLKQETETSKASLIEEHNGAKAKLIAQHDDAQKQFEKDKEGLEAAKTQALEALTEEHKAEKKYLQRQVQDLNAALLNRDEEEYRGSLFKASGLPKKSDEKLRELFGEIQQMVEDLGRLSNSSWKSKQTLWTEGVITRIQGKNVMRVLKKAIVQDLVWTLLFQAVFASPFRIFGKEGETLEKEWFEQCSQDPPAASEKFPWPAPGAHAERWRYMTMKECREALTKPASELDPRTRVREGFMSSVEELSTKLKKELGSMVELGDEHLQTVDKLSKRAAVIWLDFEMHRCRILIRLSGSDVQSPVEKIAQLQSRGSLVLTVSPRLGRFGTTKGTELDRFMTVDGCGGESLKIP